MDELDRPGTRAGTEPGSGEIPEVVRELASGRDIELVWRNKLGGLTFRVDDRVVKWNPRSNGIDLGRERLRLEWIAGRHPAPQVIDAGADDVAEWLVTIRLPGESPIGDRWRARRVEAITAIAAGLKAIHAIPVDDFPEQWTSESWVGQTPEALGPRPVVEGFVIVHGDACAPNTLISQAGTWAGNVDFGDLAVGDRWADLAIASMSLDWNFGDGHQAEFFEAYGVEPDRERLRYYRELWHAES